MRVIENNRIGDAGHTETIKYTWKSRLIQMSDIFAVIQQLQMEIIEIGSNKMKKFPF